MSEPRPFTSVREFLFNAPLYAKFKLADDLGDTSRLYGRYQEDDQRVPTRIDGHCPYCGKESTFLLSPIQIPSGSPWQEIKTRYAFESCSITCARSDDHRIRFYTQIRELVIQKVGQFPSLADIANDESSIYRTVLKGRNASEFHRAVGLAAHGVGIGSFVYLRRIFERLIRSRFDEFKEQEGWTDDDFAQLRMEEKVALLKDHLPAFLVENRKIYLFDPQFGPPRT